MVGAGVFFFFNGEANGLLGFVLENRGSSRFYLLGISFLPVMFWVSFLSFFHPAPLFSIRFFF